MYFTWSFSRVNSHFCEIMCEIPCETHVKFSHGFHMKFTCFSQGCSRCEVMEIYCETCYYKKKLHMWHHITATVIG